MTPFPRHSVLFQSTPNLGGSAIIQSSRLEIFSTNRIREGPIHNSLKRPWKNTANHVTLTTSSFHLPQNCRTQFPEPYLDDFQLHRPQGVFFREMQRAFLLKKSWDAYEVGYDYQLELICNPIYPSNMFGHFYGLLKYNSIVLTRLRGPSCIDLGSHTPTTPSPW